MTITKKRTLLLLAALALLLVLLLLPQKALAAITTIDITTPSDATPGSLGNGDDDLSKTWFYQEFAGTHTLIIYKSVTLVGALTDDFMIQIHQDATGPIDLTINATIVSPGNRVIEFTPNNACALNISGSGSVTTSAANGSAMVIGQNGTVNTTGVSYAATGNMGRAIVNNGTLTLNGGSATASDAGVGVANIGTFTLAGGTLYGAEHGLFNQGTATLRSGSITSANVGIITEQNTSRLHISGNVAINAPTAVFNGQDGTVDVESGGVLDVSGNGTIRGTALSNGTVRLHAGCTVILPAGVDAAALDLAGLAREIISGTTNPAIVPSATPMAFTLQVAGGNTYTATINGGPGAYTLAAQLYTPPTVPSVPVGSIGEPVWVESPGTGSTGGTVTADDVFPFAAETTKKITVYDQDDTDKKIGTLSKGADVTVIAIEDGFAIVQYEKDGETVTGAVALTALTGEFGADGDDAALYGKTNKDGVRVYKMNAKGRIVSAGRHYKFAGAKVKVVGLQNGYLVIDVKGTEYLVKIADVEILTS